MKQQPVLIGTRYLLVLLLGFSACVSKPSAENSFQPNLSLYYTHNREGQTQPCGCSLNPLGGIEREKKFLGSENPNAIRLAGGNTFVLAQKKKAPGQLDPVTPSEMIEALNSLDLAALSPSTADLKLGRKALLDLKAKAKFPFVSTNIFLKKSKDAAFELSTTIQHGNFSVLVLGLTKAARNTSTDFDIENPTEALRRYFEKQPVVAGQLIVLISSLSAQERSDIQNKFPQIQIILGGEGDKTYEAEQLSASMLFFNPPELGRSVAKIDFIYRPESRDFFNPSTAFYHSMSVSAWNEKIENIDGQLKSTALSAKLKRSLLQEKAKYEELLKRAKTIPTSNQNNMSEYRSQVIFLDRRFD